MSNTQKRRDWMLQFCRPDREQFCVPFRFGLGIDGTAYDVATAQVSEEKR